MPRSHIPNPKGHPATLIPNASRVVRGRTETNRTHGLKSRTPWPYDARAQEIAADLLSLPHVTALDAPAARQIARLMSLIERTDECLADGRMENRARVARELLKHRRLFSRELREWACEFGMTPKSRATWTRMLSRSWLDEWRESQAAIEASNLPAGEIVAPGNGSHG